MKLIQKRGLLQIRLLSRLDSRVHSDSMGVKSQKDWLPNLNPWPELVKSGSDRKKTANSVPTILIDRRIKLKSALIAMFIFVGHILCSIKKSKKLYKFQNGINLALTI